MSYPPISDPAAAGMSAARLQRITDLMQRYVDRGRLAGALALVARQGKVVYFDAVGRRDREADLPMTKETIFRIYSMTKPIVTTAAMMLFEEGHFMLDTPVRDFIPAFADTPVCAGATKERLRLVPQERPMTIKDLMTHTAGLSYGWFKDTPVDALYRESDLSNMEGDLAARIDYLATFPLCFQPGAAWRYSFATDVLGRVVEVAAGKPLDHFLADEIFAPLGMVDTGFQVRPGHEERFASLYSIFETLDFAANEQPLPAEGSPLYLLDGAQESAFCQPPKYLSGGGGLTSTAADYLRYAQMMLNGGELDGVRLLGRKTVELMTMNHLPPGLIPVAVGDIPSQGHGFGLGGSVLVDVAAAGIPGSAGSWGWSGAAATYFWIDPHEDLLGIFMTQFMPSAHWPVRLEFRRAVYQALV
ncbi:MAG: beta-lactamase family protein [Caldilineaceae bacterium]|nr:beta-lactamase family protein [Caldilineaceae bacterium]